MKRNHLLLHPALVAILATMLLIPRAGHEDQPQVVKVLPPSVITVNVKDVTATTVKAEGNVKSTGGSQVIKRGFCWSTTRKPTVHSSNSFDGKGTGTYSRTITGLKPNTIYYIRAYATNSAGTGYGDIKSARTPVQPTATPVSDNDGNTYQTVVIGNQVWMAENLRTTRYNDGTAIPLVTDGTAWGKLKTPAYCWYSNNATANKNLYGALYNWYAVGTGKLCPAGWHVPTDAEWNTMVNFLGGLNVAGGKLKESGTSHWNTPNTGATNQAGFKGLPGGYRNYYTGGFVTQGLNGSWWSSTSSATSLAWGWKLDYMGAFVLRKSEDKMLGYSVRCVKN